MKCHSCGKEMVNTVGGCYQCPHCGMGIHDGVYRPPEFIHSESGWNFPRIGRVCSLCGENPAELRVDITEMGTDEVFYARSRVCRACATRLTQMINEEWGE